MNEQLIVFKDDESIIPNKKINGLIRYKDNCINLKNVFYVDFYLDKNYHIQFLESAGGIDNYIRWSFKDCEEGEKVYNYILDTYFTDIEKEMSK